MWLWVGACGCVCVFVCVCVCLSSCALSEREDSGCSASKDVYAIKVKIICEWTCAVPHVLENDLCNV